MHLIYKYCDKNKVRDDIKNTTKFCSLVALMNNANVDILTTPSNNSILNLPQRRQE